MMGLISSLWATVVAFLGTEAGATIAAGLLALLAVVWQIGKQARQAITQQTHNERLKLKLEVYREVLGLVDAARARLIAAPGYVRGFLQQIEFYEAVVRQGMVGTVPSARVPAFIGVWQEASDAMLALIGWTEEWQIIDPRIEIFRTAFNAAMHDGRAAFQAYMGLAGTTMPIEQVGPGGQVTLLPWQPPSAGTRARLVAATEVLAENLTDQACYIEDLQREMQNLLVGELFGYRLPPRVPLDDKYVVIALDRFASLTTHFATNTEFGRLLAAYERVVDGSHPDFVAAIDLSIG